MDKIFAPFTKEQIQRLIGYQQGEITYKTNIGEMTIDVTPHPFTCMGHDGCTRPQDLNEGILIPIEEGWICPCGKYRQNWCYEFMAAITEI